jgi:hypothetical protein
MLQLVLMNRESDFMGLDPYKLDPEYWVEKIKSSTFNRRNNSTLTLFCMTTIIFQNTRYEILHTLILGCSFITLREPCNNQRPRCDIT